MDNFKTSITKTLAYFDIFSCPLTEQEMYTYLFEPDEDISFDTFVRRIDTLTASKEKNFDVAGGYYFFPGKGASIASRERRVWYVEKKLSRAKRAARLLRFIPFVKAFFVCNQIQVGVTKKSDVDVLIVVEKGRMFFTRLLVTVVLGIFRLRRGKKKITDRMCLSFYVTSNALNFASLQVGTPDIYFTYWLATLIPVYDPQNYLEKIFHQNEWAKKSVPHAFQNLQWAEGWRVGDGALSVRIKKMFEKALQGKFGETLEKKVKQFQLKHMAGNTESVQNQDSRVVISDTLLKFHENDRRDLFRQEWEKRWKV